MDVFVITLKADHVHAKNGLLRELRPVITTASDARVRPKKRTGPYFI
jgi:hypothetical protein